MTTLRYRLKLIRLWQNYLDWWWIWQMKKEPKWSWVDPVDGRFTALYWNLRYAWHYLWRPNKALAKREGYNRYRRVFGISRNTTRPLRPAFRNQQPKWKETHP